METYEHELCECPCHTQRDIRHIVTCCYPCDFCGKLIVSYYHKRHTERCEKEYYENENKKTWRFGRIFVLLPRLLMRPLVQNHGQASAFVEIQRWFQKSNHHSEHKYPLSWRTDLPFNRYGRQNLLPRRFHPFIQENNSQTSRYWLIFQPLFDFFWKNVCRNATFVVSLRSCSLKCYLKVLIMSDCNRQKQAKILQ